MQSISSSPVFVYIYLLISETLKLPTQRFKKMESCLIYPPYKKHVVSEPKSSEAEEKHSKTIASLPRVETKQGDIFCNYQGSWYRQHICEAIMAAQDHFRSLPTDILLASSPKSGTTWLQALIFSVVHRKTYPDVTKHPLLHYNPHDLVPSLELMFYGNNQILQTDVDFPSPRLFSTHIPYTGLPQSIIDSGCRIVYICRNLKDAFVSHWHFVNKFTAEHSQYAISLDESFRMYMKGIYDFGPHWDHVLGYWKESIGDNSERVLFLKYEQFQVEPAVQLRKLAAFLGVPFSKEEETNGVVEQIVSLCSFEKLTSLEVNKAGSGRIVLDVKSGIGIDNSAFFRKGKVNDSVNYLTEEMIKELDAITEEKLQDSGLTF